MSLPPRWFGDRGEHGVIVARRGGGAWVAVVDGHPLGHGFGTEREARLAAAAQVLRAEGTAHALVRRVRRGLWRKLR
jgi:hypothetical protein